MNVLYLDQWFLQAYGRYSVNRMYSFLMTNRCVFFLAVALEVPLFVKFSRIIDGYFEPREGGFQPPDQIFTLSLLAQ